MVHLEWRQHYFAARPAYSDCAFSLGYINADSGDDLIFHLKASQIVNGFNRHQPLPTTDSACCVTRMRGAYLLFNLRNVTGKLTDERFIKLSTTYETEQAELKQSIESLSAIVEATEAQTVNVKSFLKIVKRYTEPTELTPQLLHEFVDKIVVHEADKS